MGKISRIRKFNTENECPQVQADLGNRKRFTEKDLLSVVAKTDNQQLALDSCFSSALAVGLGGSSGSGKTFIALYSALKQVFDPSTPYEKVIIARSAVATREQGFLKGSLEEKEEIFQLPYQALCKELLPRFNNGYEHLKSLGYVEFTSTSYLRGLTFHDTIVIVDEYQSLTRHEIYTILTRIGENSKIFLCGDHKQSDLKKEQSCFNYIEELSSKLPEGMCRNIRFTADDIVRSEFVKAIIMIDEAM